MAIDVQNYKKGGWRVDGKNLKMVKWKEKKEERQKNKKENDERKKSMVLGVIIYT